MINERIFFTSKKRGFPAFFWRRKKRKEMDEVGSRLFVVANWQQMENAVENRGHFRRRQSCSSRFKEKKTVEFPDKPTNTSEDSLGRYGLLRTYKRRATTQASVSHFEKRICLFGGCCWWWIFLSVVKISFRASIKSNLSGWMKDWRLFLFSLDTHAQ